MSFGKSPSIIMDASCRKLQSLLRLLKKKGKERQGKRKQNYLEDKEILDKQ